MPTTARLKKIVRPGGTVTKAERKFAKEAIATLGTVLADPAFAANVSGSAFSSTLCLTSNMTEQNPNANQVLAMIQSGAELANGIVDQRLDLSIELVTMSTTVFAETQPGDTVVETSDAFFTDCRTRKDSVRLASLWMHEWMHLAGFVHETVQGDLNDAPYTLQSIVEQLAPRPSGATAMPVLAASVAMPTVWKCRATRRLAKSALSTKKPARKKKGKR